MKQMSKDPKFRKTIYLGEGDAVRAWLDSQDSVSKSIQILIRDAILKYGYVDVLDGVLLRNEAPSAVEEVPKTVPKTKPIPAKPVEKPKEEPSVTSFPKREIREEPSAPPLSQKEPEDALYQAEAALLTMTNVEDKDGKEYDPLEVMFNDIGSRFDTK